MQTKSHWSATHSIDSVQINKILPLPSLLNEIAYQNIICEIQIPECKQIELRTSF